VPIAAGLPFICISQSVAERQTLATDVAKNLFDEGGRICVLVSRRARPIRNYVSSFWAQEWLSVAHFCEEVPVLDWACVFRSSRFTITFGECDTSKRYLRSKRCDLARGST
jgi:hypothetical protein